MAKMFETSNLLGMFIPIHASDLKPWQVLIDLSLREQIGVVPQSPIMFDDTIMNNVRYAKLSATDEEVFDACRAACIHDQILGFTDGMS